MNGRLAGSPALAYGVVVEMVQYLWAFVRYERRGARGTGAAAGQTARPYPRNARTHSKKQIQQIASSIRRFGFTNPVLIDDDLSIIAGHGRVEAAKLLDMVEVPCLRLSHLSAAEKRAYILADNRLGEKAGWDREILAIELQALIELEFEMDLISFEAVEIDLILDEAAEASPEGETGPEDATPTMSDPAAAVTRPDDLWRLGRHLLYCGDARDAAAYRTLMATSRRT